MYFYLLQVNLLQCVSLIALSYILEYTIENINAMLDSIPKSEQSQIVTEKSTIVLMICQIQVRSA